MPFLAGVPVLVLHHDKTPSQGQGHGLPHVHMVFFKKKKALKNKCNPDLMFFVLMRHKIVLKAAWKLYGV